jgi:hypothetical protein
MFRQCIMLGCNEQAREDSVFCSDLCEETSDKYKENGRDYYHDWEPSAEEQMSYDFTDEICNLAEQGGP